MKNSFQENYKLFLHSWKMLFKKIIFVNQSISIKFLKEGLEEGKNKLVFNNIDIILIIIFFIIFIINSCSLP